MTRDIHNNITPQVALNYSNITTSTTTAGNVIDTKGYGAVEFLVYSGTITDGTYTPLIEEGDAANLSDAAAVADANLLGTEAGAALTGSNDNAVKRVGYRVGNYRYVRLSIVSTSVTSGGNVGALVILGNPDLAPTA